VSRFRFVSGAAIKKYLGQEDNGVPDIKRGDAEVWRNARYFAKSISRNVFSLFG
jgi:hypothetical protein